MDHRINSLGWRETSLQLVQGSNRDTRSPRKHGFLDGPGLLLSTDPGHLDDVLAGNGFSRSDQCRQLAQFTVEATELKADPPDQQGSGFLINRSLVRLPGTADAPLEREWQVRRLAELDLVHEPDLRHELVEIPGLPGLGPQEQGGFIDGLLRVLFKELPGYGSAPLTSTWSRESDPRC